MTNLSDVEIEAAAERLLAGIRERDDDAAALRFIHGWVTSFREAIAHEILAQNRPEIAFGMQNAARIVRGGTP